jgi:competence protein ComEA
MERNQRLILFLIAAVFATLLLYNSHSPSRQDGVVAFSLWSSAGVMVRIRGRAQVAGVYPLPHGCTVADVIKMTVDSGEARTMNPEILTTCLRNGDVVEVAGEDPQRPVISLTRMKAREQIALGIPLHPDQLDSDDWDLLPGIGPKLAKDIITYRQNNGDFCSIDAVRRVPGMGEKKFNVISKYFEHI